MRNRTGCVVTYEHLAINHRILPQIFDHMSVPAPLGHQSGGNSTIALVLYGKANESEDIWVLEILPGPHFPP